MSPHQLLGQRTQLYRSTALTPALHQLLCYSWGHPQPHLLQGCESRQALGRGNLFVGGHVYARVTLPERMLPTSPSTPPGKPSLPCSSRTHSGFRQAAPCNAWPWGGGSYLWCLGSAVTVIKAGASSMASKYSVSSSSSLASPFADCTLPVGAKGLRRSGAAGPL